MTNKEVVQSMYEVVLNGRNLDRASEFIMEDYIQHNPRVNTGLEGFISFFRDVHFKKFPNFNVVIKRIIAEGDYVVVHLLGNIVPGEIEAAVVDIYRLEDGKVAEHWDVIQPMPTEFLHDNGMF